MISKFNNFNEKLKIDTYKSAADKLAKIGHVSRAKRLNDHINKSLSDHVFNFWIFSSSWSQANQSHTYKNVLKAPIQGKIFKIDYDHGLFEDSHGDGSDAALWISVTFEIDNTQLLSENPTPLERMHFKSMKDCGFIRGDNNQYLELFNLQPFLGHGKKFQTNGDIGIETLNSEFIGKFADRKSAVEFKRALKNVLFNKVLHYGYDKDEHTDELLTISDSIRNDLLNVYEDSSLGDVESLYYSLCNLNTNLLYTEDGVW